MKKAMESSEARRAGTFFAGDARIEACLKLAALERNWDKAAGRAAGRTRLQSCGFTPEGLKLVVNVSDASVLQSLKFKKAALERSIAKFMQAASVSVEFRVGPVDKKSAAKPPRPDCERRAPVLISPDDVEKARKPLDGSDELTEAVARVKAVSHRLAARKKTGRQR